MQAAAVPLIDRVRDVPYAEVDTIHSDPTEPRASWGRGCYLHTLPAEAVDALVAAAAPDRYLPLGMVELRHLGGALRHQPDPLTAATGRDAGSLVGVVGPLSPPLHDTVPELGQSVLDVLGLWAHPESPIQFPSAPPAGAGPAWSASTHARLVELKRRYDADGTFSTGHTAIHPDPLNAGGIQR